MQRQRKGDFTPKYYNDVEIENDKALLPAERVRELVKHYSMCLFGLATDMANAEQQLTDRQLYVTSLENENKKLKAENELLISKSYEAENELIRELREKLAKAKSAAAQKVRKLTTEERQAIQADYYEHRIRALKMMRDYYKNRCKALEQKRGNDNGK